MAASFFSIGKVKSSASFAKTAGLPSDRIIAIYEDRRHAVWLATENGLVRFVPALSAYAEPQALHGAVISETRSADAMYVGTVQGAFRMRTARGAEPTFDEVTNVHDRIFVLIRCQGRADRRR